MNIKDEPLPDAGMRWCPRCKGAGWVMEPEAVGSLNTNDWSLTVTRCQQCGGEGFIRVPPTKEQTS